MGTEWVRVVLGEEHLEALRRAFIEWFHLSVHVCVCVGGVDSKWPDIFGLTCATPEKVGKRAHTLLFGFQLGKHNHLILLISLQCAICPIIFKQNYFGLLPAATNMYMMPCSNVLLKLLNIRTWHVSFLLIHPAHPSSASSNTESVGAQICLTLRICEGTEPSRHHSEALGTDVMNSCQTFCSVWSRQRCFALLLLLTRI